jgi:uncharacterized cupin superfamily protein
VIFNLLDGRLDDGEDKPGYVHRRHSLRHDGLLGATLYETPPGEKLWPYHWERGCEEFAIVVSGQPTMRTPEGERVLAPGDVVHFPEGEPGTHQFRNDTEEPVRVLLGSSKSRLYVAGYPDSRKLNVSWPGERHMVRDTPELDYWDGEG